MGLYKSTKGNERNEWVLAVVERTFPHFIEARRIKDDKPAGGPPMDPAYEDCRLAPVSPLAQELMRCSLEEELENSADGGRIVMTN